MTIQDILTNIQNSQNAEQALIAQLTILTNVPNYTVTPEVTAIVNSINSLSDARIAMFKSISDNAGNLQNAVSTTRTDLVSQLTLLQVVEDQLNKATKSMNDKQNRNDTKIRQVEINTYYGQRYAAQSDLMKMIIIICVPLLILFILRRKGLLPDLISRYAIGITLAVGAIFVIRAAWNISTRSNINFDEFNWNYEDPSAQVPTIWQYNKEHLFNFDNPIKSLVGNLGLCVGSNCCANGMYFDPSKQQCSAVAVAGSTKINSTLTNENFVCGNTLNGTPVYNFNEDDKKQNGISPFSYSSDYASV